MLKIAIPLAEGKLCMHFGHCEEFAVVEADETAKQIRKVEFLTPPPHEPGVLPRWIASLGVQLVIAGGMGGRAQELFAMQKIRVLPGAPALSPEELCRMYFSGTLVCGENVCDHDTHPEQHNCGKS